MGRIATGSHSIILIKTENKSASASRRSLEPAELNVKILPMANNVLVSDVTQVVHSRRYDGFERSWRGRTSTHCSPFKAVVS